ncbi:hypothetical protein Tco_1431739 [Tanacetum coccineum]
MGEEQNKLRFWITANVNNRDSPKVPRHQFGRDPRLRRLGSSSGAQFRKLQLQRKESSSEYLRIKERELKLEERKRQEQGELERLRIAQRDKELDLQQKMFEFQQQQKFEEDLKYYNEDHEII